MKENGSMANGDEFIYKFISRNCIRRFYKKEGNESYEDKKEKKEI